MRATEDEMIGWHHQLDRHEFEQTPGDSEGKGSPRILKWVAYPLDSKVIKPVNPKGNQP